MIKRLVFISLLGILFFTGCEYNNEKDLNANKQQIEDSALSILAQYKLNGNFLNGVETGESLIAYGDPQFDIGLEGTDSTAISLDGDGDFLSAFIGFRDSIGISLWFTGTIDYAKSEHRGELPALVDYGAKAAYAYVDAETYATIVVGGNDTLEVGDREFTLVTTKDNWTHLYLEVSSKDTLTTVSKIYINGVLSGQNDSIHFEPLIDLIYFGRASRPIKDKLNHYIGKIDEITIYGNSLTDEEIKYISNLSNYVE